MVKQAMKRSINDKMRPINDKRTENYDNLFQEIK